MSDAIFILTLSEIWYSHYLFLNLSTSILGWRDAYVIAHMRRWEDNFQKLVLSFHRVAPGNYTLEVRTRDKLFHPMSHPRGPEYHIFHLQCFLRNKDFKKITSLIKWDGFDTIYWSIVFI